MRFWSDSPVKRGVSPSSSCTNFAPDSIVAFSGDSPTCRGCHYFVPGDDNTGDGNCHNIATSGFRMARSHIYKVRTLCDHCSHCVDDVCRRISADQSEMYRTASQPRMCRYFDEDIKATHTRLHVSDIDSALFG